MPDPAYRAAFPTRPTSPPTSSPAAAIRPTERLSRYRVREVAWGNRKRFVVRDTATNTTIAIRTTRQIADSDLMRLNWSAGGHPDPTTATQPALRDSPAELILDHPTRRQCGRCRQYFALDPTLAPGAIHDWWLCEPCRDKLMGTRPAPTRTSATGSTAHSARSSTASAGPVPAARTQGL